MKQYDVNDVHTLYATAQLQSSNVKRIRGKFPIKYLLICQFRVRCFATARTLELCVQPKSHAIFVDYYLKYFSVEKVISPKTLKA